MFTFNFCTHLFSCGFTSLSYICYGEIYPSVQRHVDFLFSLCFLNQLLSCKNVVV